MKNENIKSLKKLALRKKAIEKEIKECEESIMDNYVALTQPVSNFVQSVCDNKNEDNPRFEGGIYKFALNTKRVVNMVRLGVAVYRDYSNQESEL